MKGLRFTALSGMLWLAASAQAFSSAPKHFVGVKDGHFEVDGKPYYYVGTNFWYGMNLGAQDPARLERELDRLAALGVRNLRVMASTQGPDGEPWRISPSLENSAGVFDEKMFRGLDRLLAAMQKRGMRAVVCLGDFWPWSGGMSQYLSWNGAGSIPYPPPAAGGSWDEYQAFTDKFYANEKAVRAAEVLDRAVVGRVNYYTGVKYSDDPAIMAWELANEPRGGTNVEAFNQWLKREAELLKSLDSHHLVTTGSEGETPWPAANGMDVKRNHSSTAIDYVTAHIWVQNWSWFDPVQGMAGLAGAVSKMDTYLRRQAALAKQLGKPLVLEEFGIGRDGGSNNPASATTVRDRYYGEVFGRVLELARAGGGVSGVNFWAWAGEARPAIPYGGYWHPGLSFLGDPPHEAQGWYSIYDSDRGTQAVIRDFAGKLTALSQ